MDAISCFSKTLVYKKLLTLFFNNLIFLLAMANIKDEHFRYSKKNSEIAYGLFRKYRILGSSNRYQASIHPLILIPALKRSETGYAEVSPPCLQ